MDWKQLADQLGKELTEANRKILSFQYQLAEQAEQLRTSNHGNEVAQQTPDTALQKQIQDLQAKLELSEQRRHELSRAAAAAQAKLNDQKKRDSALGWTKFPDKDQREHQKMMAGPLEQISEESVEPTTAERAFHQSSQPQGTLSYRAENIKKVQAQLQAAAIKYAQKPRIQQAGTDHGRDEDDSEPNVPTLKPGSTAACGVEKSPQGATRTKPRIARKRVHDCETAQHLSHTNPSPKTPKSGPRKIRKIATNDEGFHFKLVESYPSPNKINAHNSEDMRKVCPALWEAIDHVVSIWEEEKGLDWHFEFTKSGYKPSARPCITTKFVRSRADWREGCGGKYACRNCVKMGRPCFTFTGESFWLLPLHPADRQKEVRKGYEIRHWLNK